MTLCYNPVNGVVAPAEIREIEFLFERIIEAEILELNLQVNGKSTDREWEKDCKVEETLHAKDQRNLISWTIQLTMMHQFMQQQVWKGWYIMSFETWKTIWESTCFATQMPNVKWVYFILLTGLFNFKVLFAILVTGIFWHSLPQLTMFRKDIVIVEGKC